ATKGFGGGLKSLNTICKLRHNNYDLAINMRTIVSWPASIKLSILIDLINAKKCAGRNTERRGQFFDISIVETDNGTQYEMDYDIELVKKIGAKVYSREVVLNIKPEVQARVKKLLKENGIEDKDKVVVIHPGGMPSRRWGTKKYIELISKLNSKGRFKFILTGTGNEGKIINEISESCPYTINLCQKLSIFELGCLIRTGHLMVSNDTGPMHLAAVLKVPQIALFGPGDLMRYDPRNINKRAAVVYHKTYCAPCNETNCDKLECMQKVSVEEVAEKSMKALTNKQDEKKY
ncbi:glycosyltransferase family 9 protein, partial [Candidatus Margulisiibacteriota bacterium]